MIASSIEAGVMQDFFLIDDITLLMEIEPVRASSSSPRQIVRSASNRRWCGVNVIRFMKHLLILITGKWGWKLSSRRKVSQLQSNPSCGSQAKPGAGQSNFWLVTK
jgi:hypothetical protein